jgi:Ser/Thr protein kinase RdoA (MazF antagonist)
MPTAGLTPFASIEWRILLPGGSGGCAQRLLLWNGAPGLAERLIEVGAACTVSIDRHPRQRGDAVVAFDATASDVARAAAVLEPSGVAYLELSRCLPSVVTLDLYRLRRAFTRAGFGDVAMYAIRRSGNRTAYIPLDGSGAWHWYWRTLHQARTVRSWVLASGLRAAERARIPTRYLALDVAVTAVKRGPRPIAAASILAQPLVQAKYGPGELRPLLLAGQRTVVFAFRLGESAPLAALKMPAAASPNGPTANEHKVLHELRGCIASPADIPKPELILSWQGRIVAVESIVAGQSMERVAGRCCARQAPALRQLRAAAGWLTDFHSRTASGLSRSGSLPQDPWLSDPVERYQTLFGCRFGEDALFARARRHSSSLAGVPVPIVHQHRDFRPANVLVDDGAIRVIDWEGCRPGAPLCDLLHFIVDWQVDARRLRSRAARLRGFMELFLKPADDPVADAMARAVSDYVRALRLDPRFLPLALVITWTELAVRHAERNSSPSSPHSEEDNESLALVRTLAGHVEALFGGGPEGSLLAVVARTAAA